MKKAAQNTLLCVRDAATTTSPSLSVGEAFSLGDGLLTDTHSESSWDLVFVNRRTLLSGARESVAAHGLHRPIHQRPALTTNQDSRPGVGVATGARFMRDGVTGSACSDRPHPSRALGLDSAEDSYQMEKVITHITLPQLS